ncbi:protein-L-isoaspartate O-methyltransferase [Fulvitalea axinellae]|uniref:Protein-L-isoaspartate O-methyltransferase n=1 Tax=Fulvitalea axinellae TaxID=1182444 RepID=A0AAU9CTZ1_9BACT|nr:protein-L-isoaspartate O-methyltransferase [Fulvitalea axinellae]
MTPADSYKHKGLRRKLVETLKGKGIRDENVLSAIGALPRHWFFESAFWDHAYQDKAFPIGNGQTISQPYTVAFMTELLDVKAGDHILEIGTGSGYQAAILSLLGASVYTVECISELHESAKNTLETIGIEAVNFLLADGSKGWAENAPYDKIIVTAASPAIPAPLMEQLKIGGKLVIPLGDRNQQRMTRMTKTGQKKAERETFGHFRFVPLVGENGWED